MRVVVATTQRHFFEICAIRTKVFVEEQKVPVDEEIDVLDQTCKHLLIYVEDKAVGCCRLLDSGTYLKIGRLAVLREERGKGYASQLLQEAEKWAKTKGYNCIKLGAQVQALAFYHHNGYQEYGSVFDDAGIDHVMMEKKI